VKVLWINYEYKLRFAIEMLLVTSERPLWKLFLKLLEIDEFEFAYNPLS
jgi:hypothetical protein